MSSPTSPDIVCFEHQRRVEFSETDMAGIMHFANFYRFMESAEHAFFRTLGHSIHGDKDGKTIGFPRVDTQCKFFKPLKFEDRVTIKMSVLEIRNKSLRCGYWFYKTINDESKLVAMGEMAIACVELNKGNGSITAILIPDYLREKLEFARTHNIQ